MQNGHARTHTTIKHSILTQIPAAPFPPSRSGLTSPPATRPTSWAHHKPEPSSSARPASASARPVSWSPNPKSNPVSPGRPFSWNSHSKSHSAHNLQMPLSRRGSEELEHSSAWISDCRTLLLTRQAASSLGSSRASSSSQSAADCEHIFMPSILDCLADYHPDKERHDDLERDRLRERERLWNHPQPKSPARSQLFGRSLTL